MRKEKKFELIEIYKKVLSSATFRQSGITFTTTVINGALGAVFYIVAARLFGPASFGILSVAITVLMLGASIGGLGVNTGLVRFVSKYRANNLSKANQYIKLSLQANVVIGLAIFVIGLFSADFLAVSIFQKPELVEPLRISSLGVLALLLFGFATRYLQAFERFWAWGILQIGANLIRIVFVGGFFIFGLLTLNTGMWIYALLPLLGFLIAMIFVIPIDFLKVKNEYSVAKEFFHYNKWIAGFTLIAAFSSRVDIFLATRLVSSENLGLYSAANQMVYIVPQIVGALGTVIAPKMAAMSDMASFVRFFKKSQMLVLGLAFLGILAAPLVALFVPLIFGIEYSASIPIFVVLLLSMLIFLIAVPVHNAILYYFSFPKLFLWLGIGHLAIMMTIGWILINTYGIMGAAVAVLVGSIFNFVVPAAWVFVKLRNYKL